MRHTIITKNFDNFIQEKMDEGKELKYHFKLENCCTVEKH